MIELKNWKAGLKGMSVGFDGWIRSKIVSLALIVQAATPHLAFFPHFLHSFNGKLKKKKKKPKRELLDL